MARMARKAAWLAFGIVALAAVSSSAHQRDALTETSAGLAASSASPEPETLWSTFSGGTSGDETPTTAITETEADHSLEATRAYKQALATLSTLTASPPSHTQPLSYNPLATSGNSFLSSFLPNIQGQGPIASSIRIAIKLRQQSWLPHFVTSWLGKDSFGMVGKKKEEEQRGKAIKVVDLLQHSADLGNMDALYKLAHISLFPPTDHFPLDPALAYNALSTHAAITGNASSQALLAFFHATGYHGVVPIDQARAQLYYTFAAQGGHKGAQMALAYRYWSGIGALEDCGRALDWYEAAAEQAMAKFLSGPPGGRTLPLTSTRLSDLAGGVYGPGASVASTGLNSQRPAIRAANARAAGETWEEVLEYYVFNADRGETDFAYRLGKIFYQGSLYASFGGIASGSEGVGAVPRDFARARYYFLRIARQVWPRDPQNPGQSSSTQHKEEDGPIGYAAASAAYLGRMFLRGEGVKADPALAKMWFERGAEYGDKECHNGLGIIWRDGLVDGKKDLKKALVHFDVAAGQELAEAQVNRGKYHYSKGEVKLAQTYFETALRNGSPFEAYYYLALIQATQIKSSAASQAMSAGSCAIAVSFYKLVSERGVWDDDVLKDAEVAWNLGTERGREGAILRWWIAAERGSEIAQNNLAYVLDQDRSMLRLTRFAPMTPSNDTARLALTQWTRSAAQHNVDALVKVGDYYYQGLGVPNEPEPLRWEKAAGYYQAAAQTQMSALAMWNLGWMYENGVGVPQDFHLAKRHYDLALATNSEAYLPVILSLVKLYGRSLWHTMMGGKDGLDLWAYEDYDDKTLNRDNRQIAGGQQDQKEVTDEYSPEEDIPRDDVGEDGGWYFGKAREEFNKRRQQDTQRSGRQEDDPVQWARDRRNAENERDSDFGPEDYFEGATRGGYRDEEDDFAETMLLVGLCLLVTALLYIRGRWVERLRREEERRRQAGGNVPPARDARQGGVFPPPGDPARDEWAILR